MNKKVILDILNDWNFWQKDLNTGIRRGFYLDKLNKFLASNQIVVITGPRRSGKSFLMKQMADDLIKKGTKREDILMINFEDPRWEKLDTALLEKIFEVYLELVGSAKKPYVFLDEIQEVKEWEKWVRTAQELDKAKIIVSGSNAKLLSKELATLLTGRHLSQTVLPLSFKELLMFKGIKIDSQLSLIENRIKIKRILNESLEFGLFPEIVFTETKKELLLDYFNDIINKDISERYKIRKKESLKSLVKFYLSNNSALTTFSSAGKALDISTNTVQKFYSYIEASYLVFSLKIFSWKVKEQEKSPRKVYAVDPGLANAIGFRFSQNLGKLAENLVYLELKRRKAIGPRLEFFYWKDEQHREVDFVVKEKLEVSQLIQVCWNLDDIKTKKREIGSLLKAMKEFDLKSGLIITDDKEGEEMIENKKIKYIPLWKWLLE
ncbi:MAG: AAA family ATPase [Xanthomonadaceae bacterium]|nr:AAA family ATPase [Rhodospirillaceae bacterium]NIA18138.1 AAA family ATPase [Xanthomonadaceae bacterium]